MGSRVNIGISACLLGQAVRYDGAHKRHDLLLAEAGAQVQWIAVCPEVELGLGVPRQKIALIRDPGGVRLVTMETRRDISVSMTEWAEKRLDDLAHRRLAGFVFKHKSPSCGLSGPPAGAGAGVFAAAFTARFPGLPVIEESELVDTSICREFLERVFRYRVESPT